MTGDKTPQPSDNERQRSRRSLLKSAGLAAGATWIVPAVLALDAPPASASAGTAFSSIGTGTVLAEHIATTVPKAASGTFLLLIGVVNQGTLTIGNGTGWTSILAGTSTDDQASLYAWWALSSAGVPTLTSSNNNGYGVIVGYNAATIASAGPVQSTATATVTALTFPSAPGLGAFLFVGGSQSARTWTAPTGYTTQLDGSAAPDLYVATLPGTGTNVATASATLSSANRNRGVHL